MRLSRLSDRQLKRLLVKGEVRFANEERAQLEKKVYYMVLDHLTKFGKLRGGVDGVKKIKEFVSRNDLDLYREIKPLLEVADRHYDEVYQALEKILSITEKNRF